MSNGVLAALLDNSKQDTCVVSRCPRSGYCVIRGQFGGPVYKESLRIRRLHDTTDIADGYDEIADHYVAFVRGEAVASIRVNQSRRGRMPHSDYFPPVALATYSQQLVSASRLVRSPHVLAIPPTIQRFCLDIKADQTARGILIDIISVNLRMVSFYYRLGYRAVCNSQFQNPRLGTPSIVMLLLNATTEAWPPNVEGASRDDAVDRLLKLVPICKHRRPCSLNPSKLPRFTPCDSLNETHSDEQG